MARTAVLSSPFAVFCAARILDPVKRRSLSRDRKSLVMANLLDVAVNADDGTFADRGVFHDLAGGLSNFDAVDDDPLLLRT